MGRFRLRSVVLILLSFIVAFAAIRFWQEAHYGSGPVETASPPEGPVREVAFVANAVEGTISLIDVRDRKNIGTLTVVPDGTKVGLFRDPVQSFAQGFVERRGGLNYAQDTDLSKDGRVLFVSRGHLGDVAAFDIASRKILWRASIAGMRADHMAISPDGSRLFVSALIRSGNVVEVLDTRTGRKTGEFRTGRWPHDVHLSEDGTRVYSASLGDMTKSAEERGEDADAYRLVLADARNLHILRTYHFDAGIRPFQVTRDRRRLFAQLSNEHSVVAHDLESGKRTGRLDLPVADGVTEDDWDFEAPHHGLAISPDEKTLCAAGRASDYAAVIDAGKLVLKKTIPVGDAPSWAAISDDGRYCLLANNRSDDVSIVSLKSLTEIARIPVGRGPKHITVGQVPVRVLEGIAPGHMKAASRAALHL